MKTVRINAIPQAAIQVATGEAGFAAKDRQILNLNALIRFSGEASQDADGYIKDYLWDFGDGHTQNGFSVNHQYKEAGDYHVALQVTDNSKTACNTNSATLLVQVSDPPQIAIRGPETGCVGQPLEFAIPEADESVQWYPITRSYSRFGGKGQTQPNMQTDTLQSAPNLQSLTPIGADTGKLIIKTFDKPGKYQIQARWGDFLSQTKEVLISALPKMQLPETVETYPGDRVIIAPVYNRTDTTPLAFQWRMGDETILNTATANHIYEPDFTENRAATYAVELTVTGKNGPDCLKAVYPLTVIVHNPPEVAITVLNHNGKETIYTGGARDQVRFSATVTNGTGKWNYTWDFGDGLKAAGSEVTHKYVKPGKYKVVLTLADALKRTSQTFQFVEKISVVRRK